LTELKVVVTCLQMQEALAEVLNQIPFSNATFQTPTLNGQQFDANQMKQLLKDADFAIVGDDFVTADAVAGSNLKGLIKWGIGYDSIEVEALEANGIRFSNTPGQFADDVSEQAIALLLAVERGIVNIDKSVRDGTWLKHRGRRLSGKSALVLGYGNLGRSLASKLVALGLSLTAYDPYADVSTDSSVNLIANFPLESKFDYMISCLPLSDETLGFVNAERLAVLQSDGVFVNVSRGKVTNQGDLVKALRLGLLAGAGLDVYEHEPLDLQSELVSMPNVVLGAHNSSNTHEGVLEASLAAAIILKNWIAEA
jgi:D-3-phosphoglycerate dehydrogenase / 2-oxoglutarate reductase